MTNGYTSPGSPKGFGKPPSYGSIIKRQLERGDLKAAQARIAELTEALKLADGVLSGANMNRAVVERKVRAALGGGAS